VPLISSSPVPSLSIDRMGNAPIAPRERQNLPRITELSSSQDERASEITRANSINAIASELKSTQDEPARYLPKMTNRSNNGVIMPSKPYGCGGASTTVGSIENPQCIDSPQWGWYISASITPPPASDMYHCGNRTLHHKKQDSSSNTSQGSTGTAVSGSSTATSHRPKNRTIFKDMHNKRKDATIGWPSFPL
jgi:hypothetical protein